MYVPLFYLRGCLNQLFRMLIPPRSLPTLNNFSEIVLSLAEFRFQSMQNSGYIPDGDIIFSECRIGLRRWI